MNLDVSCTAPPTVTDKNSPPVKERLSISIVETHEDSKQVVVEMCPDSAQVFSWNAYGIFPFVSNGMIW